MMVSTLNGTTTGTGDLDTAAAIRRVAEMFAGPARDTIRYENLFKHVYEVDSIRRSTGSEGTIADLGGGLGINLIALRLLGHRGRLILIDGFDEYDDSNRMGAFTSARALLDTHGIEIIRQDFWADPMLPLPDSIADVATSFDVIEHLPGHPLRQLRELHRLLRPGGACIISAPNAVSLMKRVKLLAGRHPYTTFEAWIAEPFYDHFREYTRAEYERLMAMAGFGDVVSRPSAAIPLGRARHAYHRRRLPALSPVRAALWMVAAIESALPPLRHSIYTFGRRNRAAVP